MRLPSENRTAAAGFTDDLDMGILMIHPFRRTSKHHRPEISLRFAAAVAKPDGNENLQHDDQDDDGDDDHDTSSPILPLVLVLSHRMAGRIGHCLRQLPDLIFLFVCMLALGFLLPPHPDDFRDLTVHELQLRRELGLVTAPAAASVKAVRCCQEASNSVDGILWET